MSEDPNFPGTSGADHEGSAGGGVGTAEPAKDLFHRPEPESKSARSTVLIWQFFLFPLLIVASALGIFLLFGAFARDADTPQELLERLLAGGSNQQAQSAHQLALLVRVEFDRQQADPDRAPPFYAESGFRSGLGQALQAAINENDSPKRQELLAIMSGLIQSEPALPALEELLSRGASGPRFDNDARMGAAIGLLYYDGRIAERALTRIATEEQDGEIRAVAMTGLVKLAHAPGTEDPGVIRALRLGLRAGHSGVRVLAAAGLGVRGVREPGVVAIVGQALTRDGLSQLGISARFQPGALRNACRAAARLGDSSLKTKVERLTQTDEEGDEAVRRVAREQLRQWGTSALPPADKEDDS